MNKLKVDTKMQIELIKQAEKRGYGKGYRARLKFEKKVAVNFKLVPKRQTRTKR